MLSFERKEKMLHCPKILGFFSPKYNVERNAYKTEIHQRLYLDPPLTLSNDTSFVDKSVWIFIQTTKSKTTFHREP